jgi:hypothetical protein
LKSGCHGKTTFASKIFEYGAPTPNNLSPWKNNVIAVWLYKVMSGKQ